MNAMHTQNGSNGAVPMSKDMEIPSWDGTLSRNDFYPAARDFADKWRRVDSSSPAWSWNNPPKRPPFLPFPQDAAEGYLSLENIRLEATNDIADEVSHNEEEGTGSPDWKEGIDDATLVQTGHCEFHYYDFHVAYGDSYRVSVLYFRGYCSDGRPLLLHEIEEDLPACSTKLLLESKWAFITQEEHPFLNRPWYKLHPCGNGEWMKLLFLGYGTPGKPQVPIERYLVSWLSVVGQVVGLRIPMELAYDASVPRGYS